MARVSTVSRLAAIAEDQWGLVTRQQAVTAGVSQATLARITSAGGVLERVAHGVYHLVGAPLPDHVELRAAWLQLAPAIPAWERGGGEGVVSHRSAAVLYGLGHLPADVHEFTVPHRRQTRRHDVQLYRRSIGDSEWVVVGGLPVTRPARVAADLLEQREDPEAVGQVIADAIRGGHEEPGTFAAALAGLAARRGGRPGDGVGLLRWLLQHVGDPRAQGWLGQALSADATTEIEPSGRGGHRVVRSP